jgi:hypothetical protein
MDKSMRPVERAAEGLRTFIPYPFSRTEHLPAVAFHTKDNERPETGAIADGMETTGFPGNPRLILTGLGCTLVPGPWWFA